MKLEPAAAHRPPERPAHVDQGHGHGRMRPFRIEDDGDLVIGHQGTPAVEAVDAAHPLHAGGPELGRPKRTHARGTQHDGAILEDVDDLAQRHGLVLEKNPVDQDEERVAEHPVAVQVAAPHRRADVGTGQRRGHHLARQGRAQIDDGGGDALHQRLKAGAAGSASRRAAG